MRLNSNLRLIISDVDETAADVYVDIDPHLVPYFEKLLRSGVKFIFSSGGGLVSIENRIIFKINPELRKNILVSHCNSSEIWGYDAQGNRLPTPFYSSAAGILTKAQIEKWHQVMQEMIKHFKLKTFPSMPIKKFIKISNADPLSIIYDDRGVQITMEVVNGYDLSKEIAQKLNVQVKDDLYDLRNEIVAWLETKFKTENLPIQFHKGGVFAINVLLSQANKGTCIGVIKKNKELLSYLGIEKEALSKPTGIEVWGDKFSQKSGPNDWCVSVELNPQIRSISFRKDDDSAYFPKGFNVQVWNGTKHLHEGLLEYLSKI
jgi:hydroxymethylpyrimidine pyrophosphatase-like HAD family hydrolase